MKNYKKATTTNVYGLLNSVYSTLTFFRYLSKLCFIKTDAHCHVTPVWINIEQLKFFAKVEWIFELRYFKTIITTMLNAYLSNFYTKLKLTKKIKLRLFI